jgi:fido (protein-threonine AMPylation protein)
LNALHPFREGNGRAQREFISHLANANGYYIAWENVSQADMLAAAIESFNGDTSKLTTFIRQNLSTPDRDV